MIHPDFAQYFTVEDGTVYVSEWVRLAGDRWLFRDRRAVGVIVPFDAEEAPFFDEQWAVSRVIREGDGTGKRPPSAAAGVGEVHVLSSRCAKPSDSRQA